MPGAGEAGNNATIQALQAARCEEGQTLFAIIIDIIAAHGPGGAEPADNVHLILT